MHKHNTLLGSKKITGTLSILFTLGMFFLSSFAIAAQSSNQTAPQPAKASIKQHVQKKDVIVKAPVKKTSLKIQKFITAVEKARSLDEVSAAFKKGNFKEGEFNDVEEALNDRQLFKKIDTLKTSVKPIRPKSVSRKINPQILLQQKQAAIKKKNKPNKGKSIAFKNTAITQRQSLSPLVTAQRANSARLFSTATAMAMPHPDLVDLPLITQEVEVPINRNSLIRGRNFGDHRGTVLLKLDRASWGIEEGIILPTSDWGDNLIRFSVPNDRSLVETVGWEHKLARIWIKVAGEDFFQATARAFVYPDYEMYRMRIDRIAPDTISPGSLIIIEGENLCLGGNRREAAQVHIRKDGKSIATQLERFTNTQVTVRMDENAEGFTAGQAEVSIFTPLNDRIWAISGWNQALLNFEPAEEVLMFKNDDGVHCTPRARLFCLIGHKKRNSHHDWELKNGWVVDDAVLEADNSGASGGGYYITRPTNGSTRAKSRIEVWCNAYSEAWYQEYFYIRGPKGVEYK